MTKHSQVQKSWSLGEKWKAGRIIIGQNDREIETQENKKKDEGLRSLLGAWTCKIKT